MTTRPIQRADLPALKNVLDNCDLFPPDYLDDMIADYLDNGESEAIWFTVCQDHKPISIAYCGLMQLTNGTYNLYAIGVHQDYQGQGVASRMLAYLEDRLKSINGRLLIIETSTAPDQDNARAFYAKRGYDHVATIPDFWDTGEGKEVFSKGLGR